MSVFTVVKQRIGRPSIIYNYSRDLQKKAHGKVLLYYKTDPFGLSGRMHGYKHVNNAEVVMMVRALNTLGFAVDIIDRTATPDQLVFRDEYTLFIGIGAGDSGKYFARIAAQVPRAKKVFYALGPEPMLSNNLILKRYDYFYERHPAYKDKVQLRRMITAVDIDAAMSLADIILCCGGDDFAADTYKKFNKPIYSIYPSSDPFADIPPVVDKKDPLHFLYFGGNGNIVKGLDIVCDVFSQLPEKFHLTICAPKSEKDFNEVFTREWGNCKNISFMGFVRIGSPVHTNLIKSASYVIFPSCSEACATSVSACLRGGLIPIVTRETGIGIACEIGVELQSDRVEYIRDVVQSKEQYTKHDILKQGISVYEKSFIFTQEYFYHQFLSFCLHILN